MSSYGIPRRGRWHQEQQPIVVCDQQLSHIGQHWIYVHISSHFPADTPRKILIPESLAIQLTNSSEISADKFFRTLFRRYQKLQRQKERENGLLRKALNHSTKSPQSQPEIVAVEHNDIDFVTENIVENRNETHTGDATQSGQSNEQNVYMDDEDMVNDYDESESSGANRLQFNETSSVYIYDDNDWFR